MFIEYLMLLFCCLTKTAYICEIKLISYGKETKNRH